MHKIKYILTFILVQYTACIFAQEYVEFKPLKVENKASISVYAQPLTLIGPYPRLQLGIDFRMANNFVIGIVGAKGLQGVSWGPVEYQFNELRPQLRYFIIDHPNFFNVSVGFELFFTQINEVKYNSAYHPTNGYSRHFTQANYSESRKGFNFFGTFSIYDNRPIVLEAYLGFGYVFRNIEYTNVIDAPVSTSGGGLNLYGDGFGPPPKKNDGEQNRLSITLGIKIGYRFSLGK